MTEDDITPTDRSVAKFDPVSGFEDNPAHAPLPCTVHPIKPALPSNIVRSLPRRPPHWSNGHPARRVFLMAARSDFEPRGEIAARNSPPERRHARALGSQRRADCR